MRRDVDALVFYMLGSRPGELRSSTPACGPSSERLLAMESSLAGTGARARVAAASARRTCRRAPARRSRRCRDIDFTVRPGEFFAVVGPSGCGKSTLLSLIAGFMRADRPARCCFDGAPVDRPGARARRDVPGLRAVPVAHRAGQRRVRPVCARHARRRAPRRGRARYIELVGLRRLRAPLSARAVGRHAPALRARAHARQRARACG